MPTVRYSCLVIVFLLLASFAVEAEQVKLRVTLQLPITNHLGVNLVQFREEVARRTNGAIAVAIFDDSRLFKDNEAVDAVASGSIEMGTVPYQQLTKKVPAIGLLEQPFLFNFEALVRAATNPNGEIRRLLDEAVLEAAGVRVLWWQSYGSSVFFSKGRDTKHPLGIRDRKVRVFGENMAKFTKHCGGIPHIISASRQHQAVKDGTVDMVMTGITGVDSRELWKVTDTITRTEHAALEFVVIINETVWQSLPESYRSAIVESSRKVEQDLREQLADIEAKAYDFAHAKGMTIHEPAPDDVAHWRACSAGLLDDYMQGAGELAWKLMGAYGRLRTHSCCSSGPQGTFHLR
jgi:C4-dicarboxylate-binding protein DctP